MSLTGTPFFVTTVALVAVALALPLACWSRVRGPVAVRHAARFGMLLLCQVTSVVMVFVIVNNANGLYDTWDDLLGTGSHVTAAADLGPDGTGGRKIRDRPRVIQRFKPAGDRRMGEGVLRTDLTGAISGVEGEVYVWLPPQYDEPAYRTRKFPVVELLPGYPGSAKAWFGALHVNRQLRPLMRSGQVAPFILVSPRTTLLGDKDTGCANIPGEADADTWLSVDVRTMVDDTFRADERPGAWAVAGYSAGGYCAARLVLSHPDRYAAAASLSGYNDPAAEPDSLTAADPELRRTSNLSYILRHAGTPPRVALYLSGELHDGYTDGLALLSAAKKPTLVHPVLIPAGGGHTTRAWAEQVPAVFRWLTRHTETRQPKAR